MFELRNTDEIWYKSKDMLDWIQYGKLIIIEPKVDEDNAFLIKKFDFKTNSYIVCNDFTTYKYNDKDYTVTNGYFKVEEKTKEEPLPSEMELIQAEILLNQAEIMAKQNEQDEILAAILLEQQTV